MICPKFELGGFEDLMPKLEDNSVDLIYTDPPYGMSYLSNIPGDKRWNKSQVTESKFDKEILNDKHGDIDFALFAREAYRVLKPNTYLVLHCNVVWIGKNIEKFEMAGFKKTGFKNKGTICWSKKFSIGGDVGGAMKRDWEPILYLAKGCPKMRPIQVVRKNGEKTELVWRKRISEIADWEFKLPKAEKTGFPTQKPKALCKQIILLMSDENQVVLDPFAGSGTIGRVACDCGRQSVSFELDKDVFDRFLSK